MVAAIGHGCAMRSPVRCRPHAQSQARAAGDAFDSTHQHHWRENAAVLLEARSEIRDFNSRALLVAQRGNQDRRVGYVVLLGTIVVQDVDAPDSYFVRFMLALQ